jgi:hydrogenase nickel incorporation protein HypB
MCEKCGCSDTADHGGQQGHQQDPSVAAALSQNDRLAERNRGFCLGKRVCVVNLLSFPRSNARALAERTAAEYGQRRRVAVLTVSDLEKMEALHAHHQHAHQDRHGHTHEALAEEPVAVDAHAVGHALSHLDLDHLDLVLIENGGSAACQAVYDLGETARVAIFSVGEGELKPLKFPLLFAHARAAVINETNRVGSSGFDVAKARANLAQVAPHAVVLELAPETGAGMEAWYAFLDELALTNGK